MKDSAQPDPRDAVLTSPAQVDELCSAIRAEKRFAFDTEFIGEYSYTPRVWLVQVATSERLVLVDPERVDLTPIWRLVLDPEIETVVFSGQQDFEICTLWMGSPPANVFDIQVAAGLAGCDYPMSYSRLAGEWFGAALKKKETYSDWSRRPLSRAQLQYAIEDIRYLLAMHDRLVDSLRRLGRAGWLREEMRTLEAAGNYDPCQTASLTAVKGYRALTPRQLAVLDEVVRWREHAAWSRNVPARKYMPDDCLLELARRQPNGAAAVLKFRGFPRGDDQSIAADVVDAIRRGLAVPDDCCPVVVDDNGDESNGVGMLTDLAVVLGRAICQSNQIAHRLFAVRRDYDELTRALAGRTRGGARNACRLLAGWRGSLTKKHIVPALSGKAGLKVQGFPDQPTIQIDGP